MSWRQGEGRYYSVRGEVMRSSVDSRRYGLVVRTAGSKLGGRYRVSWWRLMWGIVGSAFLRYLSLE
jgi:hypothetical protein